MFRLLSCFLFLLPKLLHAEVAAIGYFSHDGHEREHYLFVPADATDQTPLVIALHGMGGNAANLRFGIGLTEAAADVGFAVLYPQGLRLPAGSRHWNAAMDMMPVDDLGYLTALARFVIAQHALAPDDTTVFGISMGGFMAYHMACHSDLPLDAIISAAGNMSGRDWQNCPNPNPPSLLHIHGQRDPMIRFTGSQHWSGAWGNSPPVPELIENWAQKQNAVATDPVISHPKVNEHRYYNAATGDEIQLLVLPELGHDWPTQANAGFRALDPVIAFIQRRMRLRLDRPD